MDPLSALRDFTIRDEIDEIVRVDDDIRFGSEYSFPCSMATAYWSKQGRPYTLQTLIHFMKNQHLRHADYMRNAFAQRIPIVTLPDRNPLLDYLHGRVSYTDGLFAPQTPPRTATRSSLFKDDDDDDEEDEYRHA